MFFLHLKNPTHAISLQGPSLRFNPLHTTHGGASGGTSILLAVLAHHGRFLAVTHTRVQMAAADDAFMGALEAAERELKATGGGAASSSSAQTPATDAADEAGVSNSPAGGPSPTAPYAASDDEPDVLSPTAAAASSAGGEVEHSPKERSGRGSDERRSSGGSGRHRGSTEGESRSTFKARVIKEVKTGAATSPASALPKPARRPHARTRTRSLHRARSLHQNRSPLRTAFRQRCTASSPRGGSHRRRTSRSWRASSPIRS